MNTRVTLLVLAVMLLGSNVEAKLLRKTVSYQHEGEKLEGYMAYNDSFSGKRPAVLIVHEWWGLNDYVRRRTEQFAGMGYVAFALDMYGKGKVTSHPSQAGEWSKQITSNVKTWQGRARAGLEVLVRHPKVDTSRVVAVGYCFGGSTVQQLAYSGADVRGVVSFHGSLQMPEGVQKENVKASILICHGAADPFVKAGQIEGYISAMEKSGLDWQMIIYAGAKHGFTNPGADKMGIDALKYSKSADQRSWADMRVFFAEILR